MPVPLEKSGNFIRSGNWSLCVFVKDWQFILVPVNSLIEYGKCKVMLVVCGNNVFYCRASDQVFHQIVLQTFFLAECQDHLILIRLTLGLCFDTFLSCLISATSTVENY